MVVQPGKISGRGREVKLYFYYYTLSCSSTVFHLFSLVSSSILPYTFVHNYLRFTSSFSFISLNHVAVRVIETHLTLVKDS